MNEQTTAPTITAVTGSNPLGKSAIAADPRFAGAQSVQVAGSGFDGKLVAIVKGPDGIEGYHWPAVANVTETGFDLLGKFPVRGPYSMLLVGFDGRVSPWFDFSVI